MECFMSKLFDLALYLPSLHPHYDGSFPIFASILRKFKEINQFLFLLKLSQKLSLPFLGL